MFENIMNFFKKLSKKDEKTVINSRDAAKERLHLVLMQDRANVSADFLELMKQEIIEVIKKYIEVDEGAIDVRLTNKENDDGTNGAPALYANIPILNIKNEARKVDAKEEKTKVETEKKEKIAKKEKEEQAEIIIDSSDENQENKEEDPVEEKMESQKEEQNESNKEEKTEDTKEKLKSEK
jgi:cell division topological specificity factor